MLGNRKKNRGKRVAAAVLASSLVMTGQPLALLQKVYASDGAVEQSTTTTTTTTTTTAPTLALFQEEVVSTGVILREYQWNGAPVKVIRADLANPYVRLDVMTGQSGQFPKRDTVLNMSRQTGAIAGVNADFFDPRNSVSSPFGAQISNGTLMGSTMPGSGFSGMYAFGITKDNRPVIELFNFKGTVMAANGQTFDFSVINKTPGRYAMAMYTGAWGSKTRGQNEPTPPTEVLVEDGFVKLISYGAPIDGLPPANGYILRTSGKGAEFIAANVREGERLEASYTLTAINSAAGSYTQDSFKMLVGGHTILVADGKPAVFSRDVSGIGGNNTRSRTAAGFSQDGRFVFLVVAERAGGKGGVKLSDLQQILVKLGVWRAVNLDGGGSTTIVSRPLGEFRAELENNPEDGSMRKVVNGIGVYTTASTGELQGLIIGGATLLWKGETATYSAKAYDTHYNPLDPSALASVPVWSVADGNAIATPTGQVTATAAGNATIAVKSGAVKQTQAIEIADANSIVKLDVTSDIPPERWISGNTYQLSVTATLRDGRQRTVPPELVRWERTGASGVMEAGAFRFTGFTEGAKEAMLIARYDGYSARLAFQAPNIKPLADFESVPWPITFWNYPDTASGSVAITDAYNTPNKSLALRYDFTGGDDSTDKAAYALFNGEHGIGLSGEPGSVLVDVYSDGNAAWLRAEFADKDGNVIRKTLAEKLDWTGWKTVSVDLTGTGAVKLKRIYVVSKAQMSGEIAIDNLGLVYPESAGKQGVQVKMTVGKRDVTVGGQPQKLDQPPLIENERTFVPVRFVVDALGGNVNYVAAEKKVTIRKGSHLVELWLGKNDLIADGERVTSDVTPLVRKGRTLLPIRVVSERLGLNIQWLPETREITIDEGK
ncbi:stalk domain-containing protein [Paenibacillus alkalitolerans]|uniref:stalk domain-containing protein n=1 Tax=Paenibacillus alkalitolerans TaxID=2799335 RepID=UPI0018F68797|nr:stalk domain-containing protein [Paenibacillus alkalitolerans]